MNGLTAGYRALLKGALAVRPLVLLIGLAVAGASYFLFTALKAELAPVEDQGNIYVMFRAPEGATIEYTDAYAKQLEQICLAVPEADRVFVVSGNPTVSQGTSVVRLKPGTSANARKRACPGRGPGQHLRRVSRARRRHHRI